MKFQFSPLIGHLRSYIDIKSIADVRNSRYILLSPRAIRPTRRLWAGLLSPAMRGPGYILPTVPALSRFADLNANIFFIQEQNNGIIGIIYTFLTIITQQR